MNYNTCQYRLLFGFDKILLGSSVLEFPILPGTELIIYSYNATYILLLKSSSSSMTCYEINLYLCIYYFKLCIINLYSEPLDLERL